MAKINLVQVDKKLHNISKRLSLSGLKPINEDNEKRKFFRDQKYSPVFKYADLKPKMLEQEHMLRKLQCDDSAAGIILEGIRDKYILDIALQKTKGTSAFTEISRELHGATTQKLVRQAKKLILLKVRPERIEYSTSQIIRKLQMAFVKYGFSWEVEQKNMVANAAVRAEAKKLLIRRNSRFSKSFLKRIIVHEIGTHIMRAENGRQQPYLFFSRGLPGYLMTEEGLAVYNEELHGCLNNYVLKIYAGRVLAVNSALESSFSDTYKLMRKYFTKNTSWRLTLRAKRGMIDTALPGAYTKDIAYLKGYLEVKKYVENGNDINKLYYGKVGIQHINSLDEIPGLKHPKVLPMYRYLGFLRNNLSELVHSVVLLDKIQDFRLESLNSNKTCRI